MKVLVCGGRKYCDAKRVNDVLDTLHRVSPISLVIHGGQSGADTLAGLWADAHAVRPKPYPVKKADWDKWGKSAGPRRNAQMLEEGKPDLVIAFPGGAGTANMVKIARRNNVRVRLID